MFVHGKKRRDAGSILMLLTVIVVPEAWSARASAQCQLQQLAVSTGIVRDYFGQSLALDGDLLLVGSMGDAYAGEFTGAAYLYRRSGTNWQLEKKLTAADAASRDFFGSAVTLRSGTAVIGASGDSAESGSAYIFNRQDTTWTQTIKLRAPAPAPSSRFGQSVDLSGDLVCVGAAGEDGAGSQSGAAYVFRLVPAGWQYEYKLTSLDSAEYDEFGVAVSISGDRIVVGSPFSDATAPDSGAAYVFRQQGASWVQEFRLVPPEITREAAFGSAVAISGDLLVVGAYLDQQNRVASGTAYVFRREATRWVQEAKIAPSDGLEDDQFGTSVAIDGDMIIVGAPKLFVGARPGAAYMFRREDGVWRQKQKLTAPDATAPALFGYSVQVGPTLGIVGAPYFQDLAPFHGSTYVYGVAGDCNTNGTPDDCDVQSGTSMDVNQNHNPDECEVVCVPPSFSNQPTGRTVCAGHTVTFHAAASGTGTVTYRWRRDGVGIPGASSPFYVILSSRPENSGNYDVRATNECGSTISDTATLVVWAGRTGDLDGDDYPSGTDIPPFLNILATSPDGPPELGFCAADMNGDGIVNATDVRAFVTTLLLTYP